MRILAILFALLLIVAPVVAQDIEATPVPVVIVPPEAAEVDPNDGAPVIVVTPPAEDGVPESVQVAIVIAIAGVLGVAIVAYATSRNTTPKELYWSLPGMVTQLGVPTLWELAMRQARTTASLADDQALIDAAKLLGYSVEVLSDGRTVLTKAPPPVG